jgi:transposase
MPIPKPPYTAQFRQQIVELVHAGRKPSALSREFGCHVSSIHNWVRQAQGPSEAATPSAGAALSNAERQELHELRRKLRQVQQERDILAKATAWFANKGEQTFTPSIR